MRRVDRAVLHKRLDEALVANFAQHRLLGHGERGHRFDDPFEVPVLLRLRDCRLQLDRHSCLHALPVLRGDVHLGDEVARTVRRHLERRDRAPARDRVPLRHLELDDPPVGLGHDGRLRVDSLLQLLQLAARVADLHREVVLALAQRAGRLEDVEGDVVILRLPGVDPVVEVEHLLARLGDGRRRGQALLQQRRVRLQFPFVEGELLLGLGHREAHRRALLREDRVLDLAPLLVEARELRVLVRELVELRLEERLLLTQLRLIDRRDRVVLLHEITDRYGHVLDLSVRHRGHVHDAPLAEEQPVAVDARGDAADDRPDDRRDDEGRRGGEDDERRRRAHDLDGRVEALGDGEVLESRFSI